MPNDDHVERMAQVFDYKDREECLRNQMEILDFAERRFHAGVTHPHGDPDHQTVYVIESTQSIILKRSVNYISSDGFEFQVMMCMRSG